MSLSISLPSILPFDWVLLLSPGQSQILDSPVLPLLSAGVTNLYHHAQMTSVSSSHKMLSCYFLIFYSSLCVSDI